VCARLAVFLSFLTVPVMNIDLNAPIWAIDHIAVIFGVGVDRAHKLTRSHDFPAPRAGFSRNLWLREEVLAWFIGLPAADRSRSVRRKHGVAHTTAPALADKTTRPEKMPKPHMPRKRLGASA
jgi:hypothetical protein